MNLNLDWPKSPHSNSMDVVSVTIVVIVLSFGSILVYLSNLDFERRRKSSITYLTASNNNKKAHKQNGSTSLAAGAATSKQQQVNGKLVPREMRQLTSSKSSNNLLQSSNVDANKLQTASLKLSMIDTNAQKTIPKTTTATTTKQTSNSKLSKNRVENNFDLLARPMKSEQLFALMAASSLNRDEIELAIETLLNKLESSDSNWKQPKSDPLYRLKTRLRDQEAALSTEIANHESTRTRLGLIDSSLDQARCELSKQQLVQRHLKEENTRLLEELEKIRGDLSKQQQMHKQLGDEMLKQLEGARCDLSEQQMIQKQLQEDRLQVIERLEQDKVQLQTMLLELQLINSRQEEMLRRQSDERLVNEASMRKTLLEMEQELRELQKKLSANSANQDERLRKAMRELNKANNSNSNSNKSSRNSNKTFNESSPDGKKDLDRKFLENLALLCLRCFD